MSDRLKDMTFDQLVDEQSGRVLTELIGGRFRGAVWQAMEAALLWKQKQDEKKLQDAAEGAWGTADDVRKQIRRMCKDANLSPSSLAQRAGLAPSTITRFLKGQADSLNMATVELLRSAYRMASSKPKPKDKTNAER